MLSESGIIPALAPWLKFEKPAVILPILCCYSALVLDNEILATTVSESEYTKSLCFYHADVTVF